MEVSWKMLWDVSWKCRGSVVEVSWKCRGSGMEVSWSLKSRFGLPMRTVDLICNEHMLDLLICNDRLICDDRLICNGRLICDGPDMKGPPA